MDVVIGASSYSGRYLARELLARGRRVRSLARRADLNLFGDSVEWRPLRFDDREELMRSLEGAEVLYNTYWIRYERHGMTFDDAVRNTRMLIQAASDVGVSRVVHLSVSNADRTQRYGYFKGKAQTEATVRDLAASHAIVRPTLIFGKEEILLSNVAWMLRKLRLMLIPGDGKYQCRPIYVEDLARIAVDLGEHQSNVTTDAAGPEIFTWNELIMVLQKAVSSHALVMHVTPSIAVAMASALGVVMGDRPVLREELGELADGLIMSEAPPLGTTKFSSWISQHCNEIGRHYVSERRRHWV
jgi:NADH dehydrogenase